MKIHKIENPCRSICQDVKKSAVPSNEAGHGAQTIIIIQKNNLATDRWVLPLGIPCTAKVFLLTVQFTTLINRDVVVNMNGGGNHAFHSHIHGGHLGAYICFFHVSVVLGCD